jgi:predicted acylesterase/phospholipase RssA
MKPFRKHVAIAIDGGGLKGVIVTRALAMLEEHLGQSIHQVISLSAGTSTGSIISAGITAGLSARQMFEMYCELAEIVFCKSWRTWFWPLTPYRYSFDPLECLLRQHIGDRLMGEFWTEKKHSDLVITAFDLVTNHTRFIKPWKEEYKDWPLVKAVLASCCVPTYFPPVEGRYVDGGVGAYSNPCYLAAYELLFCLGWQLSDTTLISLGTGRSPVKLKEGHAERLFAWQWLEPMVSAFLQSADDQQVHLVNTFYQDMDFRRFQLDLRQPFALDDVDQIPRLAVYGEELGRMILNDLTDSAQEIFPQFAPTPFTGEQIRLPDPVV